MSATAASVAAPAEWTTWRAALPEMPAGTAGRAEIRAALARAQDGLCALCLGGQKPLELDHDHPTGYARGLLCKSCNCRVGRHESGLFRTYCETVALYLANPPASGFRWLWDLPERRRPDITAAIAVLQSIELPPLDA